jgi:hypothetical protein
MTGFLHLFSFRRKEFKEGKALQLKQHNIYPIIVGGIPRMQLAIYNRLDKNKE